MNPDTPNQWIEDITQSSPPFVQTLAKSLYHEAALVRWPRCAIVTESCLTPRGLVSAADDDWEGHINLIPAAGRALSDPTLRDEFRALVKAESAELDPKAYASATFRYAGGIIPEVPPNVEPWKLLHLYEGLIRWEDGDVAAAERAAQLYTQSAAWVALHPVAYDLCRAYPVLIEVLQARAFTMFPIGQETGGTFEPLNRFDPEQKFAPGRENDHCGFVI